MTGKQRQARRRKVAEGIAALVQLAATDAPEDVKEFDGLPERDQASAMALARATIQIADGLMESVTGAVAEKLAVHIGGKVVR